VSGPTWLAFLAAAAMGAPARYLLDGIVSDRVTGAFPWGTFVVNVSGSFLLGVLTGLALFHHLDPDVKVVLGSGFCGAYTTFSTFTFETVRLVEEGATAEAARNAVGTLLTGAAAAAAGLAVAGL